MFGRCLLLGCRLLPYACWQPNGSPMVAQGSPNGRRSSGPSANASGGRPPLAGLTSPNRLTIPLITGSLFDRLTGPPFQDTLTPRWFRVPKLAFFIHTNHENNQKPKKHSVFWGPMFLDPAWLCLRKLLPETGFSKFPPRAETQNNRRPGGGRAENRKWYPP